MQFSFLTCSLGISSTSTPSTLRLKSASATSSLPLTSSHLNPISSSPGPSTTLESQKSYQSITPNKSNRSVTIPNKLYALSSLLVIPATQPQFSFKMQVLSSSKSNQFKPWILNFTFSPTCIKANAPPPTTSIPMWEQIYADVDNPYYMTDWPFDRNASLRSSCGSIWSTYFYQWIATADRTTFEPPFQTSVHTEVSKGITLDYIYATWTSTFIISDVTIETLSLSATPGTTGHSDFTAFPPCCRTCTFSMGDIEVYHWPTGAQPAVQTLTNTEGYTL